MLQLNNLEKLTEKRKRVGRGGKRGRYSGRGRNGQKARPGAGSEIRDSFEGGQMPLVRRIPRRGFNNPFKKVFLLIQLEDLETKFAPGETVNKESLREKGMIKSKKDVLVKILGNGSLSKKLTVHADAVSASASDAIQKAGGSVQLA